MVSLMSMDRFYRLSACDPRDARQIGPRPNGFKPCLLQQALHPVVLSHSMLEEKPALRLKMPRGAPDDFPNRVQSILSRDERAHRFEAERFQMRVAARHVRRVGEDEVEALRADGLKPLALKQ